MKAAPLPKLPRAPLNVSCWPRLLIEKLAPPAGALLISVHDRSDGPVPLQLGWKDVLHLRFHDTDGSQLGLEVFSDAQAQEILSFLEQNSDCEHIFVNCAAGQSRSAGIALCLAEAMDVPAFRGRVQMKPNDSYYNRKVYRTLQNAIFEAPTRTGELDPWSVRCARCAQKEALPSQRANPCE